MTDKPSLRLRRFKLPLTVKEVEQREAEWLAHLDAATKRVWQPILAREAKALDVTLTRRTIP